MTSNLACKWSEKINSWSKAIIKLQPFREAPNNKFGFENDGLGPTKLFMWPKIRKSLFSVMDFGKKFWEIFDFFQKSKMDHFLPQFTTRHVWILEKSHKPWRWARKIKKINISDFFSLETSPRTFFNDRKSIFQNVKMWKIMKKNQKSLKLFCKNPWLKRMIF